MEGPTLDLSRDIPGIGGGFCTSASLLPISISSWWKPKSKIDSVPVVSKTKEALTLTQINLNRSLVSVGNQASTTYYLQSQQQQRMPSTSSASGIFFNSVDI